MNKLKYFALALVLITSFFVHFYRIDHTFIFNNDEARDVQIVKKMIDTGKPVLLGPQTSVGNMYLGPLYYYFMLPALIISKMDPVGPAMMVALFGVGTSLLLFYLGYKRYGVATGLIAGLFYALSPVMLHYSRSSWNPNIIPFFATLILIAWNEKSKWGWLLLGVSAGAIFQLHYVGLVMVVLAGLAKLRSKPKWADIFMALLGFVVVTSPFWLFELRHNFVNTQAFFTFLQNGSKVSDINSSYLDRLVNTTKLIISGIVGSSSIALTQISPVLWSVFAILVFIVLPLISSASYLWYVIVGSILIVSVLREALNVHYISYLFPVVSLALAVLATRGHMIVRAVTIGAILLLVYHNVDTLIYNLATIDSVQTKRASNVANYIVSSAEGRQYNIVSTPGTYATTIEYYLSLTSNPPTTSYADLVFDICENGPCPGSDTSTVLFYASGPTHPAIAEYLGHPTVNEFKPTRTIHKNEQISYGIWVATMSIDH